MRLFGEPDDNPTTGPPPGAEQAAAPAGSSSAARQTQSLYRRYRPQSFDADDLVGQEHIVRTLRNAVERGRVAHAYLFCGPRGTGKTTTARLLAKAVNCLDPDPRARPCNRCANCLAINSGATTDVIEIDAASNRGIDDIRDLRERVKYAPTQLQTKFYIIDEAHQITGAAANAFLKTLEEPPPHTKFVLATTDPEDLLPTIVSRCQRFDFRRISLPAAMSRIRTVATAEDLAIDDEAVAAIARAGTGSLRDSLGLLDQLAVYEEGEHNGDGDTAPTITADTVRALLGVSRNDRVETIATALADRDVAAALRVVNAAVEAGEDPRQLNRQLVTYLRVLMHELAGGSPDADERARALALRFDLYELARIAQRFSETDVRIRHASIAQLPLEVALVESMLQPAGQMTVVPIAPAKGAARRSSRQVDPPATANQETETPAAFDPPPPPPQSATPTEAPPPTPAGPSLRDRVRNAGTRPTPPQPNQDGAPKLTAQYAAPPASSDPDAQPAPESSSPQPSLNGDAAVAKLVTLWPRIRQDVKLQNRRIEALLAEVDPVDVQGNLVLLRAAYPFHRNRLEEEEVRTVVEVTIGRRYGEQVRVRTILRGEEDAHGVGAVASVPTAMPSAGPATSEPTAAPPPDPEPAPPHAEPTEPTQRADDVRPVAQSAPEVDNIAVPNANHAATAAPHSPEDVEKLIQAAKTIFDGEEIPDPLAETEEKTPGST